MDLNYILNDIKDMIAEISLRDFVPVFFWICWVIVFVGSLRGVDRRDELVQITYSTVLSALGICFFFTLPFGATPTYTPTTKTILFIFLCLAPQVRWIFERRLTKVDEKLSQSTAKK